MLNAYVKTSVDDLSRAMKIGNGIFCDETINPEDAVPLFTWALHAHFPHAKLRYRSALAGRAYAFGHEIDNHREALLAAHMILPAADTDVTTVSISALSAVATAKCYRDTGFQIGALIRQAGGECVQ